ncbi:Oxidoreductase molybdopterin binding domain-containing protein [Desulfurella multipotens]|uniref:Oxidoreductase molybdopterin binding domain-containing protein n=1 Tax=Desulfurella multipotens TaxID=79269 RepID=A0A1G6N1A4_9BACT|nr:molybdopterin-dependent oxidoreductase [Desulfurella multipotens]AHF98274.1 hypothetical protein DESACE_09645 [Desulfurella acetivorans A63]SDC60996.1 Oxidoreductase molybdopterin binding domain-containing protein [Desulfurella multipotens]
MPLPKGQYLIKDFIDITIEKNIPELNELEIIYKDIKKTLSYNELLNLIDTKVILDMHCVDGWSVANNEFEGISINTIAYLVNAVNFKYIALQSSGGYKSFVFNDDSIINSFICLKINGKPLSKPRGYPMRFVAPNLYAYKWVKYLEKIEFTDDKPYGYWEDRGYSQKARVNLQERFEKN